MEEPTSSLLIQKGAKVFATTTTLAAWFFVFLFLTAPVFFLALYSYDTSRTDYDLQDQRGHFTVTSVGSFLPMSLEGEWFIYPDQSPSSDWIDSSTLGEAKSIMLPLTDISLAGGKALYQGFVSYELSPEVDNPMVLSLPFLQPDVGIYLNGHKLEPYYPVSEVWAYLQSNTYFNLTEHYDPLQVYQEILISTNNQDGDTDLFGRQVQIAPYGTAVFYEKALHLFECFFMGIFYSLMMVGFVYMIMRPQRSVLTLVNLFDTVLLTYVVYTHTSISPYIGNLFAYLDLTDTQIKSASLFFLCMSFALLNDLIEMIFPTKKGIHPFFNHPLNIICFILAGLYLYNPVLSTGFGYVMLLLLGLMVMFAILWRMEQYRKEQGLRWYKRFHLWKTYYILLVMSADVLMMHRSIRLATLFLSLYSLFFIVHLFVRAYEYALPEKKIIEINKNLEETVAKRTAEITSANEILRELSIRDTLTKVYNRMYFENELTSNLEEFRNCQDYIKSIHLCIFDLDNFKGINDTYGHNTGDNQLIETMELAQKIMPEDVIISRIGGEEFTFLFLSYEDDKVLALIEKMRQGLEELSHREDRTTGSFGISRALPSHDRKLFFVKADECLYYSKEHGKNCITKDFGQGKELVSFVTKILSP